MIVVEREFRPELSQEAQEVAGLIKDGNGSKAFRKVARYFAKFPIYSGPVLGKEKVRVADLGEERTPVEVELGAGDMTLGLTLMNLDQRALSELCQGRQITAEGLLRCFTTKAEKSKHRLYLEIDTRDGALMVDSHPLMWDIESRRLVESWKYLPYSAQSSEGLRELLADSVGLIPVLISEIWMPGGSKIWDADGYRMAEGPASGRKRSRGRGAAKVNPEPTTKELIRSAHRV